MSSSHHKRQPDRESVAELVLALAHDCSSLLAIAQLSVHRAATEVEEGAVADARLEVLRDVIDRLSVIMQRIRIFSRADPLVVGSLSLNDIVRFVSSILSPLFGEGIAVTLKLDPGLPAIEADRLQIEQVLMNLLLNAREAIGAHGRIAVETATVVIDTPTTQGKKLSRGVYAHLAVSDSGPGMTQATKARAFDPFFTTKGPGAGSGLGLAGSRRIIEDHGGLIVIHSEPGRGTRVEVFLPARTPAILPPRTRRARPHHPAPEARASETESSRS